MFHVHKYQEAVLTIVIPLMIFNETFWARYLNPIESFTSQEKVHFPFLQVAIDIPASQLSQTKDGQGHTVVRESKDGLLNVRALFYLCLWYIFSAGTLFSNKYILANLHSNPSLLGKLSFLLPHGRY